MGCGGLPREGGNGGGWLELGAENGFLVPWYYVAQIGEREMDEAVVQPRCLLRSCVGSRLECFHSVVQMSHSVVQMSCVCDGVRHWMVPRVAALLACAKSLWHSEVQSILCTARDEGDQQELGFDAGHLHGQWWYTGGRIVPGVPMISTFEVVPVYSFLYLTATTENANILKRPAFSPQSPASLLQSKDDT